MHTFRRLIVVALVAAAAAACTRTQAKTTPDVPPLDVPLPPPRIVEATEPAPQAPVGLIEDRGPSTPSPRTRAMPAPRAEGSKPEPPKPEPPPVEPPKPAEETRTLPPPTLQTTPTLKEADLEREIRAMLRRANDDLNRVDYGKLNSDARVQYDQAKGFMRQADEAIRMRNLVFARTVADKAETLAAQLSGR
jgi:hypothetical protein